MTRKQLTQGLRGLHETDMIAEIKTTKSGAVQVKFLRGTAGTESVFGLLIIADPNHYDNHSKRTTKNIGLGITKPTVSPNSD